MHFKSTHSSIAEKHDLKIPGQKHQGRLDCSSLERASGAPTS